MSSTERGEDAIFQLQQEIARLQELYGRRSREIELKMGELRSALHQANEKYQELESVVGESRSLVSDSGLRGEEHEQESGAQWINQHNKNLKRKFPTNDAQRMPVRPVLGQKPQQPTTSTQTLRILQMQAYQSQRRQAPLHLSHQRYPAAAQQPSPVLPPYNTFPPTLTPVHPVFGQKPQQPTTSTQTCYNLQTPGFRRQSCLAPHYLSHQRYPAATQQPLPVPPPYNTFPPTITANRYFHFANTNCAQCNELQREVKELRSILSDLTEEPPRKMRPVPTRASKEDVSLTDEDGWSSLHHAAMRGEVPIIRELIAKSADTRLRDRRGRTPLHCALSSEKEEAAELLAEVDCGNDIEDLDGQTPLHLAAWRGYVETMRKLLSGGARTRVQDAGGCTPLHVALIWDKEAAAELLAEADGFIESPDMQGLTPLHWAALHRCVGILKTLLHKNDLSPHIRKDRGKYPIRLVAGQGTHDDVARMILSSYVLKDIDLDWAELELSPEQQEFCVEELSRCSEEIRLMKDAKVGASSVSYHDLVTRHANAVAPRLPSEGVRGDMLREHLERDFPRYADLISLRLRLAEERRVRLDQCLHCFSLFLPVTCSDIVRRCLTDGDMENFIRAVQFPPRE